MPDTFITDSLIDSMRIQESLTHKWRNDATRGLMTQMVDLTPPPSTPAPSTPSPSPHLSSHSSGHVSGHLSGTLLTLSQQIQYELETNLSKLMGLNPSRRQNIALHLEQLAYPHGYVVTHPGSSVPNLEKLTLWIEGPRTPAQDIALKTYFEEVAFIALGQAILLKNWSNRGIRKWTASDLGRLNWALSTALKPLIPLDREGWHITRPNLYSWYNPSPALQAEIWKVLESWNTGGEGPGILLQLGKGTQGYDPRFYQHLWSQMHIFGFDPIPETSRFKRNKIVFSPTLRDGSMLRSSPAHLSWIGLENSPFQLMIAELMQIWWEPIPPPLWATGTGLEVHSRDQLTFTLNSPKPSIIYRIAEMESCEAAIVLEEQIIRLNGRNLLSHKFKEQLESLPYFKRLRSAGTSLGDLQACVSLTKLRPGGLLWWAREEALTQKDGHEVLNFLLERSKLLMEWDFSELEHSLPTSLPLFPKHLYLFQRELHLETRLSHRPIRNCIQGLLRSHVELPQLLTEAFECFQGTPNLRSSLSRGQWKIMSYTSPSPQRDWLEKWPDPTSQSLIRKLDELRNASFPLANFTTIRHTPEADASKGGTWSIHPSLKGVWVSAEHDSEGRKLSVRLLPKPGETGRGSGYMILVSDENWVAPLSVYLSSEHVQQWLDQNAERRGNRWILSDQIMKWIPVPRALLQTLRVPCALEDPHNPFPAFESSLPGEWETLATEVSHKPAIIKEALNKLPPSLENLTLHAAIFVRAARALDYIRNSQYKLFSMVTPEGRIRWRDLLETLPHTECIPVSLHPKIRLSGSLPPHLPIDRIERVKSPVPGLLLATESGFSLHISADVPLFLTMLSEQLEGLSHPT